MKRSWTTLEKISVSLLVISLGIIVFLWRGIDQGTSFSDVKTAHLAAWTTAIATLVLAGFALAAWIIAGNSLAVMKKQAKDTNDRLIQSREDHQRSLRIEALASYLRSIVGVNTLELSFEADHEKISALSTDEELESNIRISQPVYLRHIVKKCNRMEEAGTIWRFHNEHHDASMIIFEKVEQALRYSHGWQVRIYATNSEVDRRNRSTQIEVSTKLALALATAVRKWQVEKRNREGTISELKRQYLVFWQSSVCRPRDFEKGLEAISPDDLESLVSVD